MDLANPHPLFPTAEDAGPQLPEGIRQLLEELANLPELKDLIRRKAIADVFVEGLKDIGVPGLAAKFVYRGIVIPVVEKSCNLATAWAETRIKNWVKSVIVHIFSCQTLQKKIPALCEKLRALAASPSPNEHAAADSIDLLDKDDLEEFQQWLLGHMDELHGETRKALDEIRDLLALDAQPRLSTMPWHGAPPTGDQLLLAKSRGVPFQGRSRELEQLQAFLDTDADFSWWTVSAPGGTGKTRLLLHFLDNHCGGWTAGFLPDDESWEEWNTWRPTGQTLIVIDYAFARQDFIKRLLPFIINALARPNALCRAKVRVLVLDRHVPNKSRIASAPAWQNVFDSPSRTSDMLAFYYQDDPLSLSPPTESDLRSIVEFVSGGQGQGVEAMVRWLMQDAALRRPLFAIMCGLCLQEGQSLPAPGTGRLHLIAHYLESKNRLPWQDTQHPHAGRAAGILIAAATACDGIVPDTSWLPQNLRPDFSQSLPLAGNILAAPANHELPKLEPDLLGETFFLLFAKKGDRACNNLFLHPEERAWFAKRLWDRSQDEAEQDYARRIIRCADFFQRVFTGFADEYKTGPAGAEKDTLQQFWDGLADFLSVEPETDHGKSFRQTLLLEAGGILVKAGEATAAFGAQILDQANFDLLKDCRAPFLAPRIFQATAGLASALENPTLPEALQASFLHEKFTRFLTQRVDIALPALVHENLHQTLGEIITPQLLQTFPVEALGALLGAAFFGNAPAARILLANGAQPDGKDKSFGATPLHLAAMNGHAEVAEVLLANDAQPNAQHEKIGSTPLHIAAHEGHADVVHVLLAKGAQPNEKDKKFGMTPLHFAAHEGHAEIVQALLAKGAQPNEKNEKAATPLHAAALGGHAKVCEVLLAHDADPNEKNIQGSTPLHTAAHAGHAAVAEVLLANGAQPDEKDNRDQAALFVAAGKGHTEIVQALLKCKAEIDVKHKKYGATPLHIAAANGHPEVVQVLLAKGAQPNGKDKKFGATPLHFAAQNGHAEVVHVLLAHGAQPNEKDNHGATPLHVAAHAGHAKVVALLLQKGAQKDMKASNGETPLDIAKAQGHRKIVNLLQKSPKKP